jgi:TRAP transporter 4TM/12TM fusion protein
MEPGAEGAAKRAAGSTTEPPTDDERGFAEVAVGGASGESDPRMRNLSGFWAKLTLVIAFLYSGYYLYTAQFGLHSPQAHRGLYWGFAAALVFLLYPVAKTDKLREARRVPFYDALLAVLTVGLTGYYVLNYSNMVARGGALTDLDIALGIAAVIVSLEVTRRVVGWTLTLIGVVAIVYTFFGPYMPGLLAHRGYDVPRFLSTMYTSFNGIFGPIAAIFATFVFIFIIFGAFLQKSGAGQFFIDLPFALAGGRRGGPAKVAVAVSALMGSVNGSPVANVMTTGSLTIPLMRRVGYSKNFSGGVESAASVGGQMLPPVMGAGAFLIAEFTRTSYVHIVLISIVPALLYFLMVYWLVDFRALKKHLVGLPKEDLPKTSEVLKRGWYFILPLVILFVLILQRYSPAFAGFWAIVSVVVIGVLVPYEGRRMTLRDLVDAMVAGAIASLTVGGIVGTIGIVVGVVNLTGLGLRFSSVIVTLSAGNLLLALVLVTLVSWLLGAGLTVTSSYIMVAILAAPALTELGVPLIAAHLIIFWVSQDANVTPPICLAAFAAASISGGSPMGTGWEAWKLARGLYIVPLLMAYTTLVTGPWQSAIPVVISAIAGLYALAAGMTGFLKRDTIWYEQGLLLIGGLLMIAPGIVTNAIGLAVAIGAYLLQRMKPDLRTPSVATA